MEDAREGPAKGRAGGRSKDPLGARASRPHKDHLGARASRPHKTWHDGREPRKGGFGAPCKGVALDGRLFAGIRMRAGRPRSRVDAPPNTNRSPPQHCRTSTPSSDVPTPPARTDSTSSESVDLMVVTAISAAFGHARTASISRPMPCASFPWVYASLATWCTAPISRTILAVEALRLVKKDPPGARASRPHKTWHEGRDPRKGGFGAPCKGVALDGRLFAGIRMRAGRPRSRVDAPPNTNRSPPQHFGLRRHPVTCQLLQRARI